jgi:hypothetical protein
MNFRRPRLLSSSLCSPTPAPGTSAARTLSQSGVVSFALLAIVFAAAVPARADSLAACVTGTVTSILGSKCTIGDKTFQFDTWSNSTNALPADDVIFTPDATNPDSPGFTLSALFGRGFPHFSLSAGSSLVIYTEELDYAVSITNPGSGAVIVGATGTETGAFVSWTDATPTTTLDALAYSYIRNGPSCFDGTLVGIFAPGGSVAFDTPSDTEDNFPSTPGCTDTTAAQGIAQIFLGAQDGVVSLTTAGYYVDETAPSTVVPTPEPETLLLVGSGLLGLATLHYRRRRGSPPAQEETA